ncbi:MAG: S-layer homology domain-containing protein [Ruminococcaceae bacterium]|nr:S-layer homology domain-containing protein [Oscillospiraceae bacterium]
MKSMKNFRKLLSVVLAAVLVFSAMPFMAVSADSQVSIEALTDFPAEDHWSYAAMKEGVEGGIIYGYEDNTVRPKGLLTRAEMCAVITRAFGAERMAYIEGKFSDVESDDWFYTDIAKAIKMRIAEGQGGGIMNPNASITRQDAIVILARALVIEKDDTTSIDAFYDSNLVADYAKGYIAAFLGRGYIHGYEDGSLRPVNSISREEFAQIMANIFSMYVRDNGAITLGEVEGEVMLTGDEVYLHNTVVNGDLIIGDGVGSTNVTMDNVTVNGRIVFRGGEDRRVYFVNTQRTDLLVVNDYNGTINFYHYSDEPFFRDGVYNTPVTFLDREVAGGTASGKGLGFDHDTKVLGRVDAGTGVKTEGGGITPGLPAGPVYPGTSESKYATVRFFEYDGDPSLYSVSVEKNTSNEAVLNEALTNANNALANPVEQGYVANEDTIGSGYDKDVDHKMFGNWYYLDGNEYKVFTKDTIVTKNTDVYYMFNYVNILLKLSQTLGNDFAYLAYEVPFDAIVDSPVTHLDGIYRNKDTIAATIDAFIGVLEEQNFSISGEGNDKEIFVFDLIDDGVINNIVYNYRLYNLLEGDTVDEYTAKSVANYFPTNETLIYQSIKRAIGKYNGGILTTEKLEAFLDEYDPSFSGNVTEGYIHEIVDMILDNIADYKQAGKEAYTNYYDELLVVAEEIYEVLIEEFMVNASTNDFYYVNKSADVDNNRELILDAILYKLNQADIVDEMYDELPDVVKAVFTESLIKDVITQTIASYKSILDDAKAEVESPTYQDGDLIEIPSHVEVIINPIEHILIPSMEKFRLLDEASPYIDMINDLLDPEVSLFDTVAEGSGYRVLSGSEYADILYKTAVLLYDYTQASGSDTVMNIVGQDMIANNTKLSNIKNALFESGADFSLFTGLLGAFSFEKLGETTSERMIENIDLSYADFVNAVNTCGFDINQNISITIKSDGTIKMVQDGNTVEIKVNEQAAEFVNFAAIINNIADTIGNDFVINVVEEEGGATTLSSYKLKINSDYLSFKVILK